MKGENEIVQGNSNKKNKKIKNKPIKMENYHQIQIDLTDDYWISPAPDQKMKGSNSTEVTKSKKMKEKLTLELGQAE